VTLTGTELAIPLHEEGGTAMFKRSILVLVIGASFAAQYGCKGVAAGVAGAAIGKEISDRHHDDDRD
jgi:hypothetical protein